MATTWDPPTAATSAPAAPVSTPRARRTARTRRAIIESAHQLIDRQGYTQTTIEQIADAADIAPRTFFRYFPSKEALVFADFEETREQLWALFAARSPGEHPVRSLVVALAAFADIIERDQDRLAWGFRLARDHPGLAGYEQTAIKSTTADHVRRLIGERLGIDPAADPRPEAWTLTVIGLFATAMQSTLAPGDGVRRHASAREAFLGLVDQTVSTLSTAIGDLR